MKLSPTHAAASLTLVAALATSMGAGCAAASSADDAAATSGNSAQQMQESSSSQSAAASENSSAASSNQSTGKAGTASSSKQSTAATKSLSAASTKTSTKASTKAAAPKLKIKKIYSKKFNHGKKNAKQTKYIVLHDTEVKGAGAAAIAQSWKGGYVAAHYVVGRDGTVVQCVPLNKIAHHAGYGDKGHNKKYGVSSKRDDMRGAKSIGKSYPDYGMNACSVGIEICHASEETYTAKQLKALDKLIAYLDVKLGKKCKIIDHKAWRSTNSDTSKAFAKYLKSYKKTRHH